MKETGPLMIPLTFPGDFKDSSRANEIRVLSPALRFGSRDAAGPLRSVAFFMVWKGGDVVSKCFWNEGKDVCDLSHCV